MVEYGHGHKLPIGGILLILAIVAAIVVLSIMGGDDSASSVDTTDSPSVDIGQGVEPSSQPVAVETETALDVEETEGLKLLKKEGPFVFPDRDEKTEMGSIVPQKTEFEVNKFHVYVVATSKQEPTTRITPMGIHSGGEKFIVLVLLRDKNGNIEESFCKIDEETGSYYYSKLDFSHGVPEYAVLSREEMVLKVHSWEVLVYG